jgi:hypothetical protein
MSSRIVVVFAAGDGGEWPFHLDAAESTGDEGIAIPDFDLTREFKQARDQAYEIARQLFGGHDFRPSMTYILKRIGKPDNPALSGDSLYGPMVMAAIQVLANGSGTGREDDMRFQVRSQLKAMRFADLSTVAVSAGVGTAGDFRPVGGMDHKLKSLANVCWPDKLSAIVLARGQTAPYETKDITPEEFLRSHGLPEIPIIYAFDAIDALGQVYEGQRKQKAQAQERQEKEKKQAYEHQCRALADRIA